MEFKFESSGIKIEFKGKWKDFHRLFSLVQSFLTKSLKDMESIIGAFPKPSQTSQKETLN